MNTGTGKKIIISAAITVLILVCLFPFIHIFVSETDTYVHAAPRSIKPAGSLPLTIDHQPVVFFVYDSRSSEEDGYSLSLPREWIVRPKGMRAGAYVIFSPMVKGTVDLVKVPHGFSLEGYILAAEEPKMRETIAGYEREDLRKIAIWNAAAFQLSYTSLHNGIPFYAEKTYIPGRETTCVITLLCKNQDRDKAAPLLTAAVSNFRWEER